MRNHLWDWEIQGGTDMGMYGVGGSAAGGVNRAYAQMSIVTRSIQDHLSKMERPFKPVMDNQQAHTNAATMKGDIVAAEASKIGLEDGLATLDAEYEMLSGVSDMFSELMQLAERNAETGEDVGAQMTGLIASINNLLAESQAADGATTFEIGMGGGTTTITDITGGVTLDSASAVAAIAAAADQVAGAAAEVRGVRDATNLTKKGYAQRMDSLSASMQELMANDDTSYATQVTYLQNRQSAIAASVGIQNAVASNSIINIFG
jgi:hypothetical protein